MTAALVVDSLHKRYAKSDRPALNGLSFTARQGEILALLGPNGAGKSTALRCVAGMLLPDSGQITLRGPDGTDHTDHRGISFLPETPDLYGGLTVEEHLRFVALAYRLRDWRPRARTLLDRFQLTGQGEQLPSELSQGMQRKVALTMAFLHGAHVVLLDEPFNGLDPSAAAELRGLMADLATDGVAVVLCTHRLEETSRMAHRLAIIDQGRDVAAGTLADLRQQAEAAPGADLETVFFTLTRNQTEEAPSDTGGTTRTDSTGRA